MNQYNYKNIYSDYLKNCNNWFLDLNWEETENNDLSNFWYSVSASNYLNIKSCSFNNFTAIQNLRLLYYRCRELTDVTFNGSLSNVQDFGGAFQLCNHLVNINTSQWNLHSLKYFNDTFNWCDNLINLNSSQWNLYNVINLSGTFYRCLNLQNLDVSNWNVCNVQDMSNCFSTCQNLTTLDVSKWNTRNVTNLELTFYGCINLTTLDVSNWETNNVTDLWATFEYLQNVQDLNISSWNTSKVIYFERLFHGCSALTALDLGDWNTDSLWSPYIRNCFCLCNNLFWLNIYNWNLSNTSSYNHMFNGCSNLRFLFLNNCQFNTSAKTASMFQNVPFDCNIWVKNEAIKQFILTARPDFTNIYIAGTS